MAEKFKLDLEDFGKVGKGALIAGVGAVVTYLVAVVPNIELGTWTPIAVAVFSVLANVVRKWLKRD